MSANIYAALAKAQAEFPAIPKNCSVSYGQTKFRYADLASIIDAVRPVLAKHNLSFTQLFSVAGEYVSISTTLMHASGERIDSSGAMFSVKGLKPQEVGSWITYWRRYALCAALGIVADDDTDAVELSEHHKPADKPKGPPATARRPSPPPRQRHDDPEDEPSGDVPF